MKSYLLLITLVIFGCKSPSKGGLSGVWIADSVIINYNLVELQDHFISFKADHSCTLPLPILVSGENVYTRDSELNKAVWLLTGNNVRDKIGIQIISQFSPYNGIYQLEIKGSNEEMKMSLIGDTTTFYCSKWNAKNGEMTAVPH